MNLKNMEYKKRWNIKNILNILYIYKLNIICLIL